MDTHAKRSVVRLVAVVAALIATLLPLIITAAAQPAAADVAGGPDPNFGTGGKTTASFLMDQPNGRAVALRPDGKIVVAGRGTAAQHVGFVAQYSPSGAPRLLVRGGDGVVGLNQ